MAALSPLALAHQVLPAETAVVPEAVEAEAGPVRLALAERVASAAAAA